jgi:TRAP transporter TAXI family solute receptor
VTELATTLSRKGSKLELVNLDPKGDIVKKLLKKYPGVMEAGMIPKNVYGTATDTQTLEFWNLFVGPKSLPEKYSYAITKALFEHQAELQKAVKAAKDNTLINAVKFVHGTIPYDPGALRYYKEKGILK